MSCLISFEHCQSICEEHGTSEHYKKFLSTVGFEPLTCIPWFPACPSNHSAIGAVDDMWLELLQYLFMLRYYKNSMPCAKGYTKNKKKIIANLQFSDWYHLNTRWLTQKEKFIMSYMSMTIYNIYSFLFIIAYIVFIIICFFILYRCNNQGKLIVQTTLTNIDVITRVTLQVWNWLWFGLFVQRSVNRNRQHLYR